MKPKRKICYWVQYPEHMWCGRWVHWSELEESASSSRVFHTAKRAFSHAETLPKGTIVLRGVYKRGIRYCEEWVKI